ncbi:MAG: hypothetical protein ACR2OJ_09380, partial [Hyphomicrobiales bacterium]
MTVKSVRQSNGRFVAVHRRPVKARKSHNFKYRVLVKGSSVASQWKTANIKCRKAAAPKPKRLLVKSIDMDIV